MTKKAGDTANPNLEKQTEHSQDLQKAADEAAAKGFYGDKVDPTPNEHYSLETGPEAPTPETDYDAATEAAAGGHVASRFPGRAKDGE
jgi:hypothetical protein